VQLHLQAQKGDAEDTAKNGEPKVASQINDDSGAITPNGPAPDVDDIMQGIAQLQAGLATIQAGLGKRASGAQASVQVHRACDVCDSPYLHIADGLTSRFLSTRRQASPRR